MSWKVLTLCVVLSLVLGPPSLFAQRNNVPVQTFTFGLNIAGVGTGTAFFKSVSGLSSESEVVEYRSGGAPEVVQKIPGRLSFGNITLKRGITGDISLAAWRKLVEDGQIQQARKNGSIVLLNASGQETARWTLTNAWPSKYSIEMDEETGQPLEVIVLAVEGMHRQ